MTQLRKTKKTNLLKGSAAALAAMFSLTLIPTSVIQTHADYVGNDIGSEAIISLNNQSTATKGGEYQIRAAYFGTDSKIPVGLVSTADSDAYADYYTLNYSASEQITNITSDVTVTYKNSSLELEIDKNTNDEISKVKTDPANAVYGTVVLDNAGEYVIEYSMDITLTGDIVKHYSTTYTVYCEVADAYFEFNENDENIIPSVYDIALTKSVNNGALKDLTLPLPKLYNDKDEEITDVEFIFGDDTSSVAGDYVKISVTGGNGKPIAVQENNGEFYIPSNYFNPDDTLYAGEGNFTIKYAYYTQSGQFISSTTKTYRVEKEYYADYAYDLSFASSLSSAITGVEVEIPKLTAQTSSSATPSGETVAISYEVVAYKRASNGQYTETKDGSIVDGKFTPWADGYYMLRYTAKDFYGNETVTKDLYIDNVKDSRNPEAVVYDAADSSNYNEDGSIKEYVDASTKLKSKTQTGNVIIYAVGATDNVSKVDEMTLTRSIRSSSKTIEINDYAEYNLIFDYSIDTLLSNNETLRQQLIAEGVVSEDDDAENKQADIENWLKENKYLIVTNDSTKTVEDGYAYLNVSKTGELMLTGTSSGVTYTVRYSAKDAAGNSSTTLSYQVVITNDPTFADAEAPEINFVTNLKNSYRTDAVITFEAPTASDDNDTRMTVITDYQYIGETGEAMGEWVVLDENYEIDLSEINKLFVDQDKPVSVTIRARAYDDYGNEGIWTKKIEIADVTDTKAPTIITEKYNTSNADVISQNQEVVLPTLVFEDDYVKYMNAEVYVNRISYETDSTDEANKIRVETPITVRGKSEERDVLNGRFTVSAGNFIASYEGEYEVKIVVSDAGGNQITTYYNYTVEGATKVEDPVITGVSSSLGDDGKAELGTAVDLPTPIVNYTLKANQAIFGVKDDDSNAVTNYVIKVVNESAPTSYKFNEKEENTFTAYQVGNYELQYFVKLAIYDTTKFTAKDDGVYYNISEGVEGKVSQAENGDIVIKSTDTILYGVLADKTGEVEKEYKLYDVTSFFTKDDSRFYVEDAGIKYYVDTVEGLKLIAPNGAELSFAITADGNVSIKGERKGTATTKGSIDEDAYFVFDWPSQVLSLTVSDTTAPEMLTKYDYPTSAEINDTIQIKKIEAKDLSVEGIDLAKSYVLLEYSGGETSFSTSYYMSEWEKATGYNSVTGDIDYQLTRNGNYKISYYVYDYAGNVNESLSYSIPVGDCESPKITIEKDFVQEIYGLDETLTLDFGKLKFSDNVTSVDALLKTLTIKVINTSTNEELENIADASEFRFSYKLDKAGTYKIEISVTDEAGWPTTDDSTQFEVSTEADGGSEVYKIVGTVLIVLAVAVLVGVILYFVISKVKKDKKSKAKNPEAKKNSKKKDW